MSTGGLKNTKGGHKFFEDIYGISRSITFARIGIKTSFGSLTYTIPHTQMIISDRYVLTMKILVSCSRKLVRYCRKPF